MSLDPTVIYSSVVFVHVLAATALMGNSLFFTCTRAALRRAGTVDELRRWVDFAQRSAAANPAAALVLLATGVYLGSHGWWREPWFHFAVAVYLADLLYAVRAAHAALARVREAAAAAASGPVPAQLDAERWSSRLDGPYDFLLASDVAVLFVMFAKPSLLECCAAFVVANGVLLVLRRRRHAKRGALLPSAEDGERALASPTP
jgi:hypothetical protein